MSGIKLKVKRYAKNYHNEKNQQIQSKTKMTEMTKYTHILKSYYNCIQCVLKGREKNDMLSRDMEDIFFTRTKIEFLELKTMSEMGNIQLMGLTE